MPESTPIESAYQFCPRCGAPADSIGQMPFHCSKCGFTLYFGPVAAVGGLILNERDEMLLVRRARDPGKGRWGLPGGFVDRSETIEQALAREVTEETQLSICESILLTTFPNVYNYCGIAAPVIDLFYVCRAEQTESIQLEPTELDTFVWTATPVDYADKMAFDSNRKAIAHWQSLQHPEQQP